MKKIANLCVDSYREFRQIKTVTVLGMLGALSVIIGSFTLVIGDFMKIGFSSVVNQVAYYLFGPVVGGIFGGCSDLIKFWLNPTGPYFPGFTLTSMLAGVIYGLFLYKKPIKLGRILAAELTVSIICNMLLGTLWLTMIYQKGYLFILPMRVLKNLLQTPVNAVLLYLLLTALESNGIKKYIKNQS